KVCKTRWFVFNANTDWYRMELSVQSRGLRSTRRYRKAPPNSVWVLEVSYILDALKKSEAERNRGVTPSLFSGRQDQLKSRVGPWVLFAALLINACVGGYWLYSHNDRAAPEPRVVATPTPQSQPEPKPERVVTERPVAVEPSPISAPA